MADATDDNQDPMTRASGEAQEVLARAATWRAEGAGVALATVVSTWGSSPRPAGSQLVVNDRGEFAGSVSGGCVESAVVVEALEVLAGGEPRVLSYGVSHEDAWSVGLACGGRIRVFVGRARPALLDALRGEIAARRGVVVATWLPSGRSAMLAASGDVADAADADADVDVDVDVDVDADGAGDAGDAVRLGDLDPEVRAAVIEGAREASRRDQSRVVETPAGEVFLRVYNPPLRLVVVGAVHIAQALSAIASQCGFAVTVIDPRAAFATSARFSDVPGIDVRADWPDEVLPDLALDARAAVVTLTHDPKIDEPALAAALATDVFYIGALGSTRTQGARLKRLRERGFDDAALARIHGPVGLRIGARSAAEIAVSIAAELVAALRTAAPER